MTDQNHVQGRKFKLFRGTAGSASAYPADFVIVCPAVDITFNAQTGFEEFFLPDCDDPEKPLARYSSPQTTSVNLTVGGNVDLAKLDPFEDAQEVNAAIPLVLLYDVPSLEGGMYRKGDFFVSDVQHSSANKGVVKFSMNLRANGRVTRTAL